MSAFVLAGFPTTTTRTSSAAPALIAAPCGPKIPAFAASRSARSMPGPRGRAPTSRAMLQPSNAAAGSSVTSTSAQQRERAVLQLERGTLGSAHPLGDLEQLQPDRPVGSEHLAGGDPEQERVADLPAGAGDRDGVVGGRWRVGRHAPSLFDALATAGAHQHSNPHPQRNVLCRRPRTGTVSP